MYVLGHALSYAHRIAIIMNMHSPIVATNHNHTRSIPTRRSPHCISNPLKKQIIAF